jgi:hypothetical protein
VKPWLIVSGALIAAAAFAPPAQAQNYPWCAYYDTAPSATNCGFVNFQQCMEDVRGIGGFCEPNTQYRQPAAARLYTSRRR